MGGRSPSEVLGWRALAGLALAGVVAGTAACGNAQDGAAPPSDADVLAMLSGLADTPNGAMLGEIRRSYPEDWKEYQRLMLEGFRTDPNPESGRRIGVDFGQRFIKAHIADAAVAPAPALTRLLAAQLDAARAFAAESPRACAHLVWRGRVELEDAAGLSAQAQPMMAQYQAALVAATAAGKGDPTKYADVGEREGLALLEAMQRTGAARSSFEYLGSSGPDSDMPAACKAGVEMMTGVAALSPDMQAVFMARSVRQTIEDAKAAGAPVG